MGSWGEAPIVTTSEHHSTISQFESIQYHCAMTASEVSKPTLKEEDAWHIALAWQELLQERVRLVEADRTHHIVSTYEWVALNISGHDDAELLYTFKAASTVWFALSCCRGYSGRENPSFWRRVFGKLREPRVACTYRSLPHIEFADEFQHPVTDAVRFFDEDRGLAFPRIQLYDHRDIDEQVEVALLQSFFHGQETLTPRMETTERKLAGLLDELMVYVIPSRSERSIPVSLIPISQYHDMHRMLELLVTIRANNHAARTLPISVRQPRFALHSIDYMDARGVSLEALERWKKFLEANRVEFTSVILPSVRSTTTSSLYQTLLGMDPAAQSLVKRGYCEGLGLGSIGYCAEPMWSALPQGHTFESLVLQFGSGVMDAMNCTWIGYALFHPDSPRSSSWSTLELEVNEVTMENVVVLEAMAKGNNLFAIQSGLASRSTTYSSAQLRSGAVIRQNPRADGEVLLITSEERFFDATRILGDDISELSGRSSPIPGLEHFYDDPFSRLHGHVFEDFFDIPHLPRNNFSELADWVCVIVPTHGIGWVLANSILLWTERAPAVASLKSLTIDSKNTTNDVLLRLLALVGSNLRMLDIGSAHTLDSKTLGLILQYCPSLESLRVCHDGSLWTDNEYDTSVGPQLKSLALRLPRDSQHNVAVEPNQAMDPYHFRALLASQAPQPCSSYNVPDFDALLTSQDSQSCPPHNVPDFGALLASQGPQPCPPYCIPDIGALLSPQDPQPCPTSAFRAPSTSAATTALRDLETLRLEAHTVSDFVQSRSAVQEGLHRLPVLRSFHFQIDQNASKKNNAPLSYSEGRGFTWSQMGDQDVALPPFLNIWIDNDGREVPYPWVMTHGWDA